jgi:hypothetical protein
VPAPAKPFTTSFITAAVLRNSSWPSSAGREDADDVRVREGIQQARITKGRHQIGALHEAAADQVLHDVVFAHARQLELRDALHGPHHGGGVVLVQELHELAGIDQTGGVAGPIDLHGPYRGILHRERGHGVSAGSRALGSDERDQAAVGPGLVDAVHGVVGVVARVVGGAGADDAAIHVGPRGRRGLGEDAAQEGAVAVERQGQLAVDLARQARALEGRQAELQIALVREEIELPSRAAHQDVRAGDVGAPGQVEAQERNASCGGRETAARGLGPDLAWQQSEQARRCQQGCPGQEALGQELAPRTRASVVGMAQRFAQQIEIFFAHRASPWGSEVAGWGTSVRLSGC